MERRITRHVRTKARAALLRHGTRPCMAAAPPIEQKSTHGWTFM